MKKLIKTVRRFRVICDKIRARLHQASASTVWDDALIEKMESLQIGLQPHSGATLFVSIDFNESYVASVTLTLGVNRP